MCKLITMYISLSLCDARYRRWAEKIITVFLLLLIGKGGKKNYRCALFVRVLIEIVCPEKRRSEGSFADRIVTGFYKKREIMR